ncbi:MAG: phenylalanine--tRNA ligase subunit beta [Pelagibacterales bacterium]|nr:phenylalanine--tRNA ligase subunit beta [Pelagibacterales bacterium]
MKHIFLVKNLNWKKKNIRGIEGDGMLCSEEELAISDNSEGIIELDEKHKTGEKFGSYLKKDFIYEIGLTPNRGDCSSVKGIARELSAKLSKKLKYKSYNSKKKNEFQSTTVWDLSELLKKQDCPLIIGREFKIEKNSSSPFSIRNRLSQIGINPNSALVDITNYILYDLGRPLHVFDLDKIKGNLKVRRAKNDETFFGLDGKSYTLTEKDLVIADDVKVVSLAGVMGSSNSCVDLNTKRVFLEVAYFDPILISDAGKRHNIITDARYRFERGIDKSGLKEGLEVATDMIFSFCRGSYSREVISGDELEKNPYINYETDIFKSITGYDLKPELQINYLKRLGFEIKRENSKYLLGVPSWRHDIFNANDIVEEIVRLDGYDKIPYKKVSGEINLSKNCIPLSTNIEIDIKNKLANLGLNEIKSYTFISPKKIIPFSDYKEELKIKNPISKELSVMRNSLYPNLLDAVSKNYAKGIDSFSIFEIGEIFKGIDYANQIKKVGIVLSGYYEKKTWHFKRRFFDFFDIKMLITQILENTFPNLSLNFIRSKSQYYHPGKSADIILNDNTLGSFGELHPKVMKDFQIKQQTVLGCFYIDNLLKHNSVTEESKLFKLSPFLRLKKDFSFILPKDGNVEDLIKAIKKSNNEIGEVLIFDVYDVENYEKKISVGVEVEILQENKVFNSEEISQIMKKIITTVKKEVNAELRSQ